MNIIFHLSKVHIVHEAPSLPRTLAEDLVQKVRDCILITTFKSDTLILFFSFLIYVLILNYLTYICTGMPQSIFKLTIGVFSNMGSFHLTPEWFGRLSVHSWFPDVGSWLYAISKFQTWRLCPPDTACAARIPELDKKASPYYHPWKSTENVHHRRLNVCQISK